MLHFSNLWVQLFLSFAIRDPLKSVCQITSCISYELSTCLALRKYSRWSSLKSSSLLGKSLTLNTNFLIPAILFITRVGVQFTCIPIASTGTFSTGFSLYSAINLPEKYTMRTKSAIADPAQCTYYRICEPVFICKKAMVDLVIIRCEQMTQS